MKITSTIPSPYFSYPGTSRRPIRRRTAVRASQLVPSPESDDELSHKQEVICGAVLALSSASTVLLCLWQLAVS